MKETNFQPYWIIDNNGRAWKILKVSTWRVFVNEGNSSLSVSVQPKSKEKEQSCKFYSFGFAMKEASKLLFAQFFPWSNDNGKKKIPSYYLDAQKGFLNNVNSLCRNVLTFITLSLILFVYNKSIIKTVDLISSSKKIT